jgi:hypothetical protein
MSKSIAEPLRQDHGGALAFDKALENVTVGLERAGKTIHDYAEDVLQGLDRPKPGSAPSVKHAWPMIRAHPIASAAAIATAIAALAGLVVTTRRPKAA